MNCSKHAWRDHWTQCEDCVFEASLKLRDEIFPKEGQMHYRNGREVKNGDKLVQLSMDDKGEIKGAGILYDAVPGNDYCNGMIAPTAFGPGACLVDCLHVDDLAAILKEKGLHKRPDGK